MAERRPDPEFDGEIQLKKIAATGLWLAVVIAVSMVLVWLLAVRLRASGRAADPPPSPLPEASERRLPPTPRLQASPERELAALREEEERLLAGYGWVNEAGGVARIPVARALELIAERGLPETPPQPAPPQPAPHLSPGAEVPPSEVSRVP
jgi:hypothetical protein